MSNYGVSVEQYNTGSTKRPTFAFVNVRLSSLRFANADTHKITNLPHCTLCERTII